MDAETLISCMSVEMVLRQVYDDEGQESYGVIPLENSFGGSVTATWDTFLDIVMRNARCSYPSIAASLTIPIEHNLFARVGSQLSDIEVIYSHPQALSQCRPWLLANLPKAEWVAMESTAEAALRVSHSTSLRAGAIANAQAGKQSGLVCLAKSLQGNSNVTRFGWVQNGGHAEDDNLGAKQSLVLLGIPNQPGGLYSALGAFEETALNLSRIESRPIGGRLGEYAFFVDVDWSVEHREQRGEQWDHVRTSLANQGIKLYNLGRYKELPYVP